MISLIVVACITVLLVILNWLFSVNGKIFRDNSIPTPTGGSLLLGHARAVVPMYGHMGAKYIEKWTLAYPKLLKIRLGHYVELATAHPKFIKALFKDKPEKDHQYQYGVQLFGDGLLFSRGQKWYTRRKLLTPSFHFEILKSYIDVFNESTNTYVQILRETKGAEHEIFKTTLSLTLDTILRCLLSYEGNCQTQDDEYAQLMYRLSVILIHRLYSPQTAINWIFYLTPLGQEYLRLKKRFLSISRNIVLTRQEKHRTNPEMFENVERLDFLDVLLSVKHEDGSKLSVEDVMEEANVFVWEGHDTTGSGVTWSLFLMSQQREYLQQCYEEIKAVFDAEQGDEYVTQNQINSLPLFSMCIKECLRIRSPVPYIGRECAKDITIDGYFIPKGAAVHIVVDTMHKSEEWWEKPNEFMPERFNVENSRNRDPWTYLPFSAGSRNCIGQNFAMTELKMAVAKVIYNFDIVAVNPEEVQCEKVLVQKPVNLFLKFLPRT